MAIRAGQPRHCSDGAYVIGATFAKAIGARSGHAGRRRRIGERDDGLFFFFFLPLRGLCGACAGFHG